MTFLLWILIVSGFPSQIVLIILTLFQFVSYGKKRNKVISRNIVVSFNSIIISNKKAAAKTVMWNMQYLKKYFYSIAYEVWLEFHMILLNHDKVVVYTILLLSKYSGTR